MHKKYTTNNIFGQSLITTVGSSTVTFLSLDFLLMKFGFLEFELYEYMLVLAVHTNYPVLLPFTPNNFEYKPDRNDTQGDTDESPEMYCVV